MLKKCVCMCVCVCVCVCECVSACVRAWVSACVSEWESVCVNSKWPHNDKTFETRINEKRKTTTTTNHFHGCRHEVRKLLWITIDLPTFTWSQLLFVRTGRFPEFKQMTSQLKLPAACAEMGMKSKRWVRKVPSSVSQPQLQVPQATCVVPVLGQVL